MQALHCHRNTVNYRLRRFWDLTGRSLSDGAWLAQVVLALEAESSGRQGLRTLGEVSTGRVGAGHVGAGRFDRDQQGEAGEDDDQDAEDAPGGARGRGRGG